MTTLLDAINSPQDLKQLELKRLPQLAEEIRHFLLENVSKTGGHFAPSMGVVELSIALHYVFNSPKDKIVWDVSHQAYTHKILTGRKQAFSTLRKFKGLSGFCKVCESEHDAFGTGHASTSISGALGLAEARDLKKESFEVIAVIGDGSMTGGMAFEGLNNLGYLQTDMTIILNDNKMSISPATGAMSDYLRRLSTVSIGPRRPIGTIFESLGFKYFGPIDGHDIEEVIYTLKKIREVKGPKLVHVLTEKGKGYEHAEDNPEKFHGLGPFDKETGELNSKSGKSYSKVFAETLARIAEKDDKVVAITAAMPSGTGLTVFAEKFPKRFYDVGIAEEHAVTFAAGLALQGIKPACAIYSTFLQRGFDQIIHDVALQNLPVRFFLDRAGLVGDDGPTHHGTFDLSYLRMIPEMVIIAPKDENELQHAVFTAMNYEKGPIAVRYPRGSALGVKVDSELKNLEIGKAELLQEGKDLTIIAAGNMGEEEVKAGKILEGKGIKA
ncbi:1-deoxy-D-xylulose-5-phosphate synthase, partial [archaeon]|nr:1-deoxy-D-xylulose-5-phosphate synthase [archaeon]